MHALIMEKCKAIIQEGLRKGCPCTFPPQEDGYCGRHKRNKEYDLLISNGKKPCRFFFRGCNTILTAEEKVTCTTCLTNLSSKQNQCGHSGCKNKTKTTYCGKHARDVYRDEEILKGIKYCDIDRGCFNICDQGFAKCKGCLAKHNEAARLRYQYLSTINEELADDEQHICCYCGNMFDAYLTLRGAPSLSCLKCKVAREKVEANRPIRIRNYGEEKMKHIQTLYNEYRRNAANREIKFNLSVEEVRELVSQPCTYCGTYSEGVAIGIDRVDNTKNYRKDNVTPCCGPCNQIKCAYSKDFFLDHIKTISTKSCSDAYLSKWGHMHIRKKLYKYESYKRVSMHKRNLEWNLPKEVFANIQLQSCYLCGYSQSIVGIDRKDSDIGYTVENSFPCCSICNHMKNDFTYDIFLYLVEQIALHQNLTAATPPPTAS
jgi:hypothetical protein